MIEYLLLITAVLCNNKDDNSLVNWIPVFIAGGILAAIGVGYVYGWATDKNKYVDQ
jgi:hypothetical protein